MRENRMVCSFGVLGNLAEQSCQSSFPPRAHTYLTSQHRNSSDRALLPQLKQYIPICPPVDLKLMMQICLRDSIRSSSMLITNFVMLSMLLIRANSAKQADASRPCPLKSSSQWTSGLEQRRSVLFRPRQLSALGRLWAATG